MGRLTMVFRPHFGYDVEKASDESAYVETLPSLTVQSQAEDADINVLMKRYGITGKLPENPRVPEYGDFENVGDYRSALHAVMDAEQRFMEFPAHVRARFDNDPQLMMDFVADGRNMDEARKLGLLKEVVDAGVSPSIGGANSPPGAGAGGVPPAAASGPGGPGGAPGAPPGGSPPGGPGGGR